MILEQLTTNRFKGLPDREFSFCEGITLVVGANRAGKSSLHQALLTALFGLGRTADGLAAQWKEVMPWDFAGEGELLLRYRTSSGRYRLKRILGLAGAELMQERNGKWQTILSGSEEVTRAVLSHIGIDSPSVFARTVSVAQGDLSRLEQADRTEIGRVLEQVLIGRSGATFEQALQYLDQKVRKPLRKAGRERISQKIDRYEDEAGKLKTEVQKAQEREKNLEQARDIVRSLGAEVPEKEKRLQELTGDPEKGQQLGLVTKLEQKQKLEEEEKTLTKETGQLQRTVNEVDNFQDQMDKLKQQLTADESLQAQDLDRLETELTGLQTAAERAKEAVEGYKGRITVTVNEIGNLQHKIDDLKKQLTAHESLQNQDLDRLETELTGLQTAAERAKEAVEGCEGRIKAAQDDLGDIDGWFDIHRGIRDNPDATEKAENGLKRKRDLQRNLGDERNGLEQLTQERPEVLVPAWELLLGILLAVGPIFVVCLTETWGIVAVSVLGVALLVDYMRRVVHGKRTNRTFDEQIRVKQGIITRLQEDLQTVQGHLDMELHALGISEAEAEKLLEEYHTLDNKRASLTAQLQSEEHNKKKAEGQQNEATNKLRDFCRQFGLDTPEDLRKQIPFVRRLKEAEGQKKTLLDNRSLEQTQKEKTEGEQNKATNKLRDFCRQFGLDTPQDLRKQISFLRRLKEAEGKKETLLGDRALKQIQEELDKKSVDLHGIRKLLESPEYASFAPTTEEIEAWRRNAEQLKNEVPKLERKLIEAERDVKNLEAQAKVQRTSHELEARRQWLESEIERGDHTVSACYEAERLLQEVQRRHRTTYLPDLQEATSRHFRRMTNEFYSAVGFGNWPDITVAEPHNDAVPPEELSGGTRDQLYFAFRLAVADQLSGGEPLPLLLDEPFANYDSDHWERALDILTDLGNSRRQVIYFTMRPEVEQSLRTRAEDRFPVEVISLAPSAP